MTISKTSKNFIQTTSRQFHLGKAFYIFYYKPKGFIKKTLERGILNRLLDEQARKSMEASAYQLTALQPKQPYYDIHFLTGDRFWYQTVFCAYSMAQHSNISLRPVIYDDGTLALKYQKEILRIFPNAQIHLKNDLDEKIETHIPARKFPYLRERRENYPNIRKLTDIHIGSEGWKLVLDSDMLFFRQPDTLLDWLQNPTQPCHMVDTETSYGYSPALMESLAGAKLAERVNVGICGLNSSELDWEQIEHWCKILIESEGTHYYQEQALIAMLMAGRDCVVADESNYHVMPDREEVITPRAVLHHYVANSKPWYFRYGWQHSYNIGKNKMNLRLDGVI